jgi:hypothetical protein
MSTLKATEIDVRRAERAVLVSVVIANGLFTTEEKAHYSGAGCHTCADGKGATVYSGQGYTSLEASQTDKEGFVEFQICGECLNRLYYGSEQ